jgi:hypothetical protein
MHKYPLYRSIIVRLCVCVQHANEISHAAESQRIPVTYENDDEDLAGSGEIEGSANEMDIHPRLGSTENQHRTDGKARMSDFLD